MNDEIRIIIVDDEDMWLRSIAAALNDVGYTIAGTSKTYEDALNLLSSQEYDIALLDINLNTKNKGIELGKMLSSVYNKPFIFITGSTDSHTLQDAIDAHPSAYLTKPVHPSSLVATVQSALNNFSNKTSPAPGGSTADSGSSFFFVKQGSKYKKIDWAAVAYLRCDQNYTIIFNDVDKTEYYIRSPLSKTLNMIIPANLRASFIQVNRSEAVQIQCIQELATDEVRTAQRSFAISESFKPALKKAITIIT